AAEMAADIQRAASGMQVAASMPPTRAENFYDYQQRTQRMGPQTMMGAAPTTVSPYQSGGFQTGYQQPYPYGDGGYNGSGELEKQGGGRRWIPWVIGGLVAVAAIVVAVILLQGHGGGNTFVPTGLVGETQTQAVNDLKAAGLKADPVLQT